MRKRYFVLQTPILKYYVNSKKLEKGMRTIDMRQVPMPTDSVVPLANFAEADILTL